nr:hypothetical protein BaRGS_009883 [Batillaria attramentaria]
MGVHLDEPSSPLPQRWLHSDLDDVVLQLSNPIHHVSKVPKTSVVSTSSSVRTMTAGGVPSSSYSLSSTTSSHYSSHTHSSADCHCGSGGGGGSSGGGSRGGVGVTASRPVRVSLDSGMGRGPRGLPRAPEGGGGRSLSLDVTEKGDRHLEKDLHEKCRIHSAASSISKSSSSVVSTSDRQRYVHTWRESKAGPRQRPGLSDTLRNHRSLETDDPSSCTDYSSMISCEDAASNISKSSTISSLCSNLDLDEGCRDVHVRVKKSATTTVLNDRVSFDCDSTPEVSDNDVSEGTSSSAPKDIAEEGRAVVTKKEKEKEPKKRRFGKKMLPRPLRRSQSAGCAKDVPAHALFLQHQIGDKGIDTLEERLKRSTQSPSQEEEAEDEDWGNARRPPPPHARPIHKTASADAAMMARDEYGNVNSQAKAKRSLAKTMKRKLLFLRRRHTDTTLGSVLKGDGKQVTKIHPEDALQWSRSFESLLMDKAGLELFRGFLRSEFSDENLEFWIACEDFKSVKSSKVPAVAQKIYTDFVAAQAPREINLDAKTRVKTLSNLDHPSKEIFEEAQRKVQALMEKDSYPRFLESDVYQRIIRSQKS